MHQRQFHIVNLRVLHLNDFEATVSVCEAPGEQKNYSTTAGF